MSDVAVPRNASSALRSEGARYPLVDPLGVTFLYHGAADSVGLRCWIHGLPASQPFDRIEGTDDSKQIRSPPPGAEIEKSRSARFEIRALEADAMTQADE